MAHERAGARSADAAEQGLLGEPVDERAEPRRAGRVVHGRAAQARTCSATSATHER